jgi:CRP-like cAMP-binding protein
MNIADLLDQLELFQADFSYKELEAIGRYMSFRSAYRREIIFNEGDPGSHMLILISGRMEISKSGDGGLHLLSYEGKGRILGEMALIDHEPRSATCVAASDCEMLSLNHDGLDRLLADSPALAYKLMFLLARLLSRRLRRTSGLLADFLN